MFRKTLLMTAVGLGVRYLMTNKQARQKLMSAFQSFTKGTKQQHM